MLVWFAPGSSSFGELTAHGDGIRSLPPPPWNECSSDELRATAITMDGVLVIDKPGGPTSHDVVTAARRILREPRIGHTGTLDPLATGVLPLVLGRATRLSSLLSASEKDYEAQIRLGSATPTYDAADRIASGEPPPPAPDIALEDIERVLEEFRGTFEQTPPPFSAKKVAGVSAYKLARDERPAALAPVSVTVNTLTVLGLRDGLLDIRLTSSAGFYVRSLAHDLGRRLGCGGHLEGLRRTRAGAFDLERCVGLAELQNNPDAALTRVVPLSELGLDLPAVVLSERGTRRAAHGNWVAPVDFAPASRELPSPGTKTRLLDRSGALIGIAVAGPDGLLRPSVVLV